MKWVKNLFAEYRAGGAVGGLELSLKDARSCYALIKRFGVSDQAIIDTIRLARGDLYEDPQSKELQEQLLSTKNPGVAAMCLVSLQNRDSTPRDAQESTATQSREAEDGQEDREEELPSLYCDQAVTPDGRHDALPVHAFDDTECCKSCGMWICTAPDRQADAAAVHVFLEDGYEDDEGLRSCHECGQRLRRTKYDLWIESDDHEDDDLEDQESDEAEEERLPLHYCDEEMTPDVRDEAILVHKVEVYSLSCERCGIPIEEVERTHASQLERHGLKKLNVPLTKGVDWDIDWDRVVTYRCGTPNIPRFAKLIHVFNPDDEDDELGFPPCRRCGERLPHRYTDIVLDGDDEASGSPQPVLNGSSGEVLRSGGKQIYWERDNAAPSSARSAAAGNPTTVMEDLELDNERDRPSRKGFTIEELRELADMLRAVKDEPEPINQAAMERLAREGRPLEEGLMKGQYRCDVFAARLAKSEIDDRWVYVLHNFGDGAPSCSWCGMAATNIEDLRLPFELRGPFGTPESKNPEPSRTDNRYH